MSITFTIILLTSVISIAGFYNPALNDKLLFDPYRIKIQHEWWRFFTCGFLHGDFFHLFINMFVLFSFGQAVESYYHFVFGNKAIVLYVLLYLSSIFAAGLSTYYKHQHHTGYRSLGASGAVSAVVFTSILFNPYAKIYLYAIIGIPGIILGIAYLIYSYYMSNRQSDHINHEAHFYGAIYGMVFTVFLKPALFIVFIRQLLLMH